jgi:hypothetical protein
MYLPSTRTVTSVVETATWPFITPRGLPFHRETPCNNEAAEERNFQSSSVQPEQIGCVQ